MKTAFLAILVVPLLSVSVQAEDMNRAADINKCRDIATDHVEYKAMPCTGNTKQESIEVYGGIAEGQRKIYEEGLQYSKERAAKQPKGGVSTDPAGYQKRLDAKNQKKRASISDAVSRGSSSSSSSGSGDYSPKGDRNPTKGSRNDSRGVTNY